MTDDELDRLADLIARTLLESRSDSTSAPRTSWLPTPVRPAPPARGTEPPPWTGAAQAFDTRIPEVTWTHTLASALASLPASSLRLALDNYEATTALRADILNPKSQILNGIVLALGPERGWGPVDREALRTAGFTLAHLGTRVLRVETAVIAALAITRAG